MAKTIEQLDKEFRAFKAGVSEVLGHAQDEVDALEKRLKAAEEEIEVLHLKIKRAK